MILDLREFETFPAHKSLEADPASLAVDFEGVRRVDKLQLDLTIQKAGEEHYCQGQVKAVVSLECSRCLTEFSRELVNDTDFIVCTKEQYESHQEAIDSEDYVLLKGSDLMADVSDIVRQAVILAVGIMPVCRKDCRGLCPQCGLNLNEGSCDCKNEKIDPRWEGLKDLSGLEQEKPRE